MLTRAVLTHPVLDCVTTTSSCAAPPPPPPPPQVRDGLVPLISAMREKGSPPDDAWLKGKYDTETQVNRGGGDGEDWGGGILMHM